jgi:hypothetical protein
MVQPATDLAVADSVLQRLLTCVDLIDRSLANVGRADRSILERRFRHYDLVPLRAHEVMHHESQRVRMSATFQVRIEGNRLNMDTVPALSRSSLMPRRS